MFAMGNSTALCYLFFRSAGFLFYVLDDDDDDDDDEGLYFFTR